MCRPIAGYVVFIVKILWVKVAIIIINTGPKVCILNEDSIVNFGSVHCGNESHGGIYIENKSDIPASFQAC